jgi:hypothetical protein
MSPWYSVDRRLGGLQSRSGGGGEEKKKNPPLRLTAIGVLLTVPFHIELLNMHLRNPDCLVAQFDDEAEDSEFRD